MKFKMAFNYRGLCETTIIDAAVSTYQIVGRDLMVREFNDEVEPDYFVFDDGEWFKLDSAGKRTSIIFCSADYSDPWTGEDLDLEKREGR